MSTATREERRNALRRVLREWGYGPDLLVEKFPVWSPTLATVRPDFVAFTRADHRDLSTSAVVAQVTDSTNEAAARWLPAAVAVAAPAMLLALPDKLTVWRVSGTDAAPVEIASSPLSDPGRVVDRLALMAPAMIARAKQLGTQHSLFPIDLTILPNTRQAGREYLTERVEGVLARIADSTYADSRRSSQLVIGALAVLMVRDKSNLQFSGARTTGALIDTAQQRYPEYFRWLNALSAAELSKFSNVVAEIGTDINFAGLEPAMVSDIYEHALITRQRRREQGTYYTPPELAREIWKAIPIERIPPEERLILDPACGSGSLLLAAADRLNSLQPVGVDPSAWHGYITSHLIGFDNDTLATEITRLSLLMKALPIGNSWRIKNADFLTQDPATIPRPSVIVSNPPWSFAHKGAKPIDRANTFLRAMLQILRPGGYLACVLPLSWISSRNSKSTREMLLDNATLTDMWRLPDATFSATTSAIAPMILVARKEVTPRRRSRPTLVKTVFGRSLQGFFDSGAPDYSYLVDPGQSGEKILYGPISREFFAKPEIVSIRDACFIANGRPQAPGRPKRKVDDATHLQLASLRDLPPFGQPRSATLVPVRYPEDFSRTGRGLDWVSAKKVLVTAKRWSTRDPWRIKAGIDLEGIVVRESFHMVRPNNKMSIWTNVPEEDRLYAIMAVLGSGLASAFIDEIQPTRNVSPSAIGALPLPTDSRALMRLAEAGRRMSEVASTSWGHGLMMQDEHVAAASRNLEKVVFEVLQVSEDTRNIVSKCLSGALAPEGVLRYSAPDRESIREAEHGGIPSFGHVLDASEIGLTLWVSGITDHEGKLVPPPSRAHGWLCEAGVDFAIDGSLNDLDNARFDLHVFDWLPDGSLDLSRGQR